MEHYKQSRPDAVMDIECYKDYFMVSFRNIETGRISTYEMYQNHPLDRAALIRILRKFRITTFNGINYDIPMLCLALVEDTTNERLKRLSDTIIVSNKRPWEVRDMFKIPEVKFIDHIDLIEVAPTIASLKEYGGKLHSRRIQDLPIEPSASIGPDERAQLIPYCGNDLDTTIDLKRKFAKQVALRTQMSVEYGLDLRSKSDAQIAEAVIKKEIERIKGHKVYRPDVYPDYEFKYTAPPYIKYQSEVLNKLLDDIHSSTFRLTPTMSSVEMPKALEAAKIHIGTSVYRLGIGGLHSSESCVMYESDDDYELHDRDVASYYPSIILTLGLFPEHLGKDFLIVYDRIYKRRMAAKVKGDKTTADSLKIVLNGSFGKFGNRWSVLYSPNLMIQVTVTGQLALLMLIERLELAGIPVVSANTDGIVIRCPRDKSTLLKCIVHDWEEDTGFETEDTPYAAIYSRDVNSYIAVKPDGKVKLKGEYSPPEPIGSSWPSPANEVCVNAVVAYLTEGTPLATTIKGDRDIRNFVNVRKVKGGAMWQGGYLGKVVRWYYGAGQTGYIEYKTNGNKVAKSEGAMPLMELPEEFPDDVDYEWYMREARSILSDINAL